MKIAVIYKSNYGATKQYAHWIAEALNADIYEKEQAKNRNLLEYDVIIYGGGLYAGGINGIDIITKNYDKFKEKKLFIFTVGLADPDIETNRSGIKAAIDKVFKSEMQRNIKFFHLRGFMDYSQLSIVHKSMMAMLKAMINKKRKDELTDEDRQILETYGKKVDFIDKKAIADIISSIKKL
ncbi:MAG: flavodoxin domain-containing protein [Proteocatella sp.]